MLLWFIGTSLVAMWMTFRDPAIDHRLVVLGALLPLAFDGVVGRVWFFHTLLFPIVSLGLVMATTVGRRNARRRLLALPIGVFWHLIFDGVWAERSIFWWPLDGRAFARQSVPVVERGIWTALLLEAVGLLLLVWAVKRFGLDDRERRRQFLRYGRIDRGIIDPGQGRASC